MKLTELIIKATPAAIAVLDTNLHYIIVSERWMRDYGLEQQDIIGKSHYEIFPDITQEWKDIHQACLAGATRGKKQDVFVRLDGSVDYVSWEIQPWNTDDGELGGIIMFTEIETELVEAEKRLQQQIELQQMLLRNLPDFSAFLFDMDMNFLLADGSTLRKANYDPALMAGKNLKDIVPPASYEFLYPYYQQILQGETIFFTRVEETTHRIYHNYGSPVLDEHGNVIAGVIVSRDVTEYEETRTRLEFTEARPKAIFNNTFQFIGFMNPDGILLDINQTTLQFTGVNREDVIGKPFWEMVLWSKSEETQDMLKSAIERARTGEIVRYTVDVISNSREITIDLSIKPVFDETGKVIQLIPEGHDVTEMVELREELIRSNKELERFAYVASHDLQEPLRMVTSFLGLLSDEYSGQLSEEADQYINFAVDGAKRMKILIEDLLLYSRIMTKIQPFTSVDMSQVIADAIQNLHIYIQDSNAEITYPEHLPTVSGNSGQLIQLLQNLISNAIKFQKEDTQAEINISVQEIDHYWQFAIQDNGIGIDPKFHEKVFQIFQRLHTREVYSGTGIGLAVCQKVVLQHQGDIWIDSELDKGTTFYFTLPKI